MEHVLHHIRIVLIIQVRYLEKIHVEIHLLEVYFVPPEIVLLHHTNVQR